MSNELATEPTNNQSRAVVPIGERGVQLRDLDGLYRFAQYVAASPFAPKGMEEPTSIVVALQMGLELGLSPMSALQNVAVINGRPGIYGDAALALVRASGLLKSYSERMEGEGDSRRCVVRSVRKSEAEFEIETSFSVADAKRAGLWGKSGPWSQYPDRMLKFRARGFNLRDNFGDVLKGFRTTEELLDIPEDTEPKAANAIEIKRATLPPSEKKEVFTEAPKTGDEKVDFHEASNGHIEKMIEAATEPEKRGPGRPKGSTKKLETKPKETPAVEVQTTPVAEQKEDDSPAGKLTRMVEAAGYTAAQLMKVALSNEWIKDIDPETTPVSALGDENIENFAHPENWPTVLDELKALK